MTLFVCHNSKSEAKTEFTPKLDPEHPIQCMQERKWENYSQVISNADKGSVSLSGSTQKK